MSNAVLDAMKIRRSVYAIGRAVSQTDDEIVSLIKNVVIQAPSAFNSQSARVVMLFNEQHHRLWDIVKAALRQRVPADAFSVTEQKLTSFAAGKGTLLFFEDMAVVADLQQQYPSYAANFPFWSEHSSGIVQFAVWTALAQEGIGASLQHYNPLIDDEVRRCWSLPANWNLRAEMPFGSIERPAGDKSSLADEVRFRVFGVHTEIK